MYADSNQDEEIFKQPPAEDCPICLLRLPTLESGRKYYTCCGKMICSGCCHAPVYDDQGNEVAEKTCPFCRTPTPHTEEEQVERTKKRMDAGDPIAIHRIGCYCRDGRNGYPQDYTKALELFHRAGELAFPKVYCNIGYAYNYGRGVEVDLKKANYYYELAAIGGCVIARHNLGNNVGRLGNMERALKHHLIAARAGYNDSLNTIKKMYGYGHATKDDYTVASQAYQEYLGEIKSPHRDEAAAVKETNRYYLV